MMRMSISGKNISVSEYLKDVVTKKSRKLERYFRPETDVQVTLSVEKSRHIAEVTIPFDGVVIRAEESTGDMYASIDNVFNKIERQVRKHRTKLAKRLHESAFAQGDELPTDRGDIDEYESNKLVKTKRFAFKPMSVDEAILQFDLLGHDFFVFSNSITSEVNVIYKRKNGGYGLIEPEYS